MIMVNKDYQSIK